MNALRHGLDAAPGVLVPGEDPAERAALVRAYCEDLRPVTPEDEAIVARMAETTWLQRRAEAAAYAAAEEAIAVHGPGTDVMVLEACAGGRGPFLRAEAWNFRLTGRFVRLVRQFTRVRETAGGASRSGETKPLSRRTHPRAMPGRGEAQPGAGPDRAPQHSSASPQTGSGPALARLAPDRRGAAGAVAGIKAIAPSTLPAGLPFPGIPTRRSADGRPGSLTPIARIKAIAPTARPGFPTVPLPVARNRAIAPLKASQVVTRAIGSVVAELVGGRGAVIELGYTGGARQSHCSDPALFAESI